jgi:hypothetical protein
MLDQKDGKSHKMTKRNIIILVVVLVLAITSVVIIVASLRGSGGEADPYKTDNTQTQQPSENSTEQPSTETNTQPAAQTPSVDPATVSEIDIPAFGIAVSYVKGVPGFAYVIQRAANNTEYVEFTSEQLVSNRCTDDKGVFATIIKNAQPGADSATVSATTKVGDVTYGLSLAAETCAADKSLLQQYQKSFKDAFPLLKASTIN